MPLVSLPRAARGGSLEEKSEPLVKLKVLSGSSADGKQIADLNLPDDTWIALS